MPSNDMQAFEARRRLRRIPQPLRKGGAPAARAPALRAVPTPGPLIDPVSQPPDPDLLAQWGADHCLRTGLLPWRVIGKQVTVLATSQARFDTHKDALSARFGPVRMASTTEQSLQTAVQRMANPALIALAESRPADADSCRDAAPGPFMRWCLALFAALLALALTVPHLLVMGLSALVTFAALSFSALKAISALTYWRMEHRPPDPPLPEGTELPIITVLVALYREDKIAEHLLERLKHLTYPRNRLDVILVVERDDAVTADAIAHTKLPYWMRALTVPDGTCKTKPRALNYALDFARGEIIGVYDAEDAPAPDQLLTVARRFAVAPPETACLQGILDFYNAHFNWLSRCFTLEYAAWFRIVLPGLEQLGFIIPLGGTTLFFSRDALEELGAWDAHNVTEDADLGVRLARKGYRTEMIPTVTEEEANARVWPWIKQRSRWLKGYALTYWVAMRAPRRLLREVGLKRFLGLHVQFAAGLCTYVLTPVLWMFWLALLGFSHPFMNSLGPVWLWGGDRAVPTVRGGQHHPRHEGGAIIGAA